MGSTKVIEALPLGTRFPWNEKKAKNRQRKNSDPHRGGWMVPRSRGSTRSGNSSPITSTSPSQKTESHSGTSKTRTYRHSHGYHKNRPARSNVLTLRSKN